MPYAEYPERMADALLDAATICLHDGCPPDRGAYLCIGDESEEPRCTECWEHYLLAVRNGHA